MKRFVVIGLGKFGFHAAKTLYEEGSEVLAIDSDQGRCQTVDPYCTEAIVMDATDKEALRSLALNEVDGALVSTGSDTSRSILITLYLHELGVKRIHTKAVNEDHGKILLKVGATEIIQPEMSMAIRTARALSSPNMIDFIPLEQDYDLIQIAPPREFIGKSIKVLNLRAKYNIHVIAIKELIPENFVLAPPADFVIKDSDILVILGKHSDLRKINPR